VANSVGMAIAGQWLAARYNKPGFELFNYNVFALAGDGCMMEGVSSEAASLAGHLKLPNLCWIYDSNRISIEGSTDLAFTEDTPARFKAYGWNVLSVEDANDTAGFAKAIQSFLETKDRPTFIRVKSHIGYGAPHKQDTKEAHGEPLGDDEIKGAKKAYGWPEDAKFLIPDGVYNHFREGIGARGKKHREGWFKMIDEYKKKHADLADELYRMQHRQLPEGWDKNLPTFAADAKGVATRESSAKVLNAFAKNIPWLLGGSADLAPSTKTTLTFEGAGQFQAGSYGGRNFHFGVREHAMTSILNGMALVKLRPYGSGFMIFSDYAKPAIRLGAIMEIPTILIFTHDSIGVGEDGPTHQPIEQLAALRATPGLIVLRPGDANEVVEAWKLILKQRHEPAALVLTRQAIPTFDRTKYAAASNLEKGAYVLADAPGGKPDVILLATGSEVSLCIDAYEKLKGEGINARVVSMPSWELFEKQPKEYRESVIPPAVTARVSVEQASTLGWARYTGLDGANIGMHTFGASAPLKEVQKKFGFTPDKVVEAARDQVAKAKARGKK
jgi:transketolase